MSAATGRKRAYKESAESASAGSAAAQLDATSSGSIRDPAAYVQSEELWGCYSTPRTLVPFVLDARILSTPGLATELARQINERELQAARVDRERRAQVVADHVAAAMAYDAATERALALLQQQQTERPRDADAAADGGTAVFPPRYSGRPAEGYTSGALFLAAEAYCGVPPMKRKGWRDPVREGSLLHAAFAGGAGASPGGGAAAATASASSAAAPFKPDAAVSVGSVLGPAGLRQAADALRQPAFPDRGFALPTEARGRGAARRLAVAADADAAAADEEWLASSREAALRASAAAWARLAPDASVRAAAAEIILRGGAWESSSATATCDGAAATAARGEGDSGQRGALGEAIAPTAAASCSAPPLPDTAVAGTPAATDAVAAAGETEGAFSAGSLHAMQRDAAPTG